LLERRQRLSELFEFIKENAVRMKLRIPLGNAQAAMDRNQYPECATALDELEKEIVKTRQA
jgi:hypothetical protein